MTMSLLWKVGQVCCVHCHAMLNISSDDLIIAPDFYMYFSALWPLLNSDPTIMCISAYADNGKSGYVDIQENGQYVNNYLIV